MSQRIKRPSSPDPEAIDEDERMYGTESVGGDESENRYAYPRVPIEPS
jgi:hypothetical protein